MFTDTYKLNRLKELTKKLKSKPDDIELSQIYIRNGDMLQLIEVSKTMNKTQAIQFAVEFTIDKLKQNKLEKLRYIQKEAHEASEELLDTTD